MTQVRLEPAALRSRVKHSTIEPLRSRVFFCVKVIDINGLTAIKINYENETVSTPLWVSSADMGRITLESNALN